MPGFVSRANWGARRPKGRSTSIKPEGLTLHWGGPSPWKGSGFDHNRCPSIVRAWQNYHMDGRGWFDIAYNAIVCPHGYVFEGRWRGARSAANGTNSGNYRSYAACYLGGQGDPLTDAAKLGFHEAARLLGKQIRWSHRDWKPTACPGDELATWVANGAGRPVWVDPSEPPPQPPPNAAEFLRQMLLAIKFCSNGVFKLGDSNDCVGVLQRVLNQKAGQNVTVDHIFGPQTEAAVKNVQRWTGITVDGIAGPQTWEMLKR